MDYVVLSVTAIGFGAIGYVAGAWRMMSAEYEVRRQLQLSEKLNTECRREAQELRRQLADVRAKKSDSVSRGNMTRAQKRREKALS